jgi:hypothetical protein
LVQLLASHVHAPAVPLPSALAPPLFAAALALRSLVAHRTPATDDAAAALLALVRPPATGAASAAAGDKDAAWLVEAAVAALARAHTDGDRRTAAFVATLLADTVHPETPEVRRLAHTQARGCALVC